MKLDRNGYAPSLFEGGFCVLCGAGGDLVRHEIYGGTRRSNSKKYGAWITLCPKCHEIIHANPKDFVVLKAMAQKLLQDNGMMAEEFIAHFGKNYLEV